MYYWMVPNTLVSHSQALACTSMTIHDVASSNFGQTKNPSTPLPDAELRPSASEFKHDLKFIDAVFNALMSKHRKPVCDFWRQFSKRGPEQHKIQEAVFVQQSLSYIFDPLRKFFFRREKETESFEIFNMLDKIVSKQYGDVQHDPRVQHLLKQIDIFLNSTHANAEIPTFKELEMYVGQVFMPTNSREEILVKSLQIVVFLISASKHCELLYSLTAVGKKCSETLKDMENTTKSMHKAEAMLHDHRRYFSRMLYILMTDVLDCLQLLQKKIKYEDGDELPSV